MFPIVVAEDEIWIRNAIVEMVNRIGEQLEQKFTVVGVAANGEEAWCLIEELWPMIVITDIQMPKMDGLEIAQKIYEQDLPIAVIILSGFDKFQYAQKAISYGVSEYLLKPVKIDELKNSLQRTEEHLHRFKAMNGYLNNIQQFLNHLNDKESVYLFKKLGDLLHNILKLQHINRSAKLNLLRIFEMKMTTLLEESQIPFPFNRIDLESREDSVIQSYFKGLLEAWIAGNSAVTNKNMNLVIKRVCEYIHENYNKDITLTDMALQSNMSISHFSTLFKRFTGHTLVNYLNQTKMDKAKELLQNPDLKIYEIANSLGFRSQPYFIRVFKKTVGVAPNEYRREMKL